MRTVHIAQMCDYCSWIEDILRPKIEDLPTICTNILIGGEEQIAAETPKKYEPTILVHGTADSVSSKEKFNSALEKIEKAAVEAYKELAKGCEAVEAVELAIRSLENTELNPDSGGTDDFSKRNNSLVIRDAAMMDSEFNAGCVGATADTLHPITLAKRVLRDNVHVLIVESGARNLEMSSDNPSQSDKFSETIQTPPNSRGSKVNDVDVSKTIHGADLSTQEGIKVYGAVARDRKGRLACGISTTDDREESIAKSSMTASGSVLGCGIFANTDTCCSVSSEDRAVYLYAPARKIVERLQRERRAQRDSNASVQIEDVLDEELNNFIKDTGESCVGAAALRVEGEAEVAFTSNYFPWACCNNGVITSGYIRGEVFEKEIGDLDMPLDCRCD